MSCQHLPHSGGLQVRMWHPVIQEEAQGSNIKTFHPKATSLGKPWSQMADVTD